MKKNDILIVHEGHASTLEGHTAAWRGALRSGEAKKDGSMTRRWGSDANDKYELEKPRSSDLQIKLRNNRRLETRLMRRHR
jgi:hypothetical protein